MDEKIVKLIIKGMLAEGLIALFIAGGCLALNRPVPDPMWVIIGGPLQGLPALLASLRTTTMPQEVTVVNEDDQAVPVESKKK